MPRRSSPPRRATPVPTTSISPRTSTRRGSSRAWPSMPRRRSCRSAGWHPASSRSPLPTLPDRSTTSDRSRCASARCRSSRPTRFKYNLTWSTDGLINEYCNPCEAIVDGKMLEVLPLEELEALLARRRRLRGVQHLGRTRHVVRDACSARSRRSTTRPCAIPATAMSIKTLITDLRLSRRRDLLKDVAGGRDPDHVPRRRADLRHGHRARATGC